MLREKPDIPAPGPQNPPGKGGRPPRVPASKSSSSSCRAPAPRKGPPLLHWSTLPRSWGEGEGCVGSRASHAPRLGPPMAPSPKQ